MLTNPAIPGAVIDMNAGFLIRVLSGLIDISVILIAISIRSHVFRVIFGWPIEVAFSNILDPLILCFYYICMHAEYGQTVGKMVLGIKVVSVSDKPMNYEKSVARFVGFIISLLPFGLGLLAVGVTKTNRGIHDFIAGTQVVRIKKPNPAVVVASIILMFAGFIFFAVLPRVNLGAAVKEGRTKGCLATLRIQLKLYYTDNNNIYPATVQDTLVPKYIKRIPECECVRSHPVSNEVRIIQDSHGERLAYFVQDSGKWLYMGDKTSPDWGNVIIDCTHTDRSGYTWSSY
jgi:uncharacterized RDD family membrane protein YckC